MGFLEISCCPTQPCTECMGLSERISVLEEQLNEEKNKTRELNNQISQMKLKFFNVYRDDLADAALDNDVNVTTRSADT